MSHRAAIVVLAVMVLGIVLIRALPIWTMPLYQDDAVISGYAYEAALEGRSLWSYCVNLGENILRFQGRLAPVFALGMMPLQAALEDNVFLYRVIQGAGQLLALGVFGLLVRAITKDTLAALLCVAIYVAIYEVRDYHDPSHAIFLLMPYLMVVGGLACVFALRSNESPAPYRPSFWMVPALNAAGILMYEMAVPLSLLSCLLLLFGGAFPWRTRIARSVIAGLPVLAIIAIGLVAKAMISSYEGTQIGVLTPAAVAAAYQKHLSAAVPLSYWWYDPHGLMVGLLRGTRWNPEVLLPSAALALAVAFVAFHALLRTKVRLSLTLLMAGATLLLLPAMLVSVSAKYQREALMGLGYLHNALSYMGSGIVLLALLSLLCQWGARLGRPALLTCALTLSCALGLVAGVTHLSSYRVAATVNEGWRYPREQMEAWMHLTRNTASGKAVVAIDRDWLNRWEWAPFLLQHWGVKGRFTTLAELPAFRTKQPVPDDALVIVRSSGRSHPAALSHFIDVTSMAGQRQVRAVAMSTSRERLTEGTLSLARGPQAWPFPSAVERGKHGYYYRQVVVPVASTDVREFSLVIAPPGATAR
ncbi:hypothetical protein [Usitatibacter palustris]|uniref:hypothetical protein n=1 Tax=Usitatibacter palustris TaxID=2732487 RepID=UPI0014883682|nr:hypothetical protein [Usitatibacter palustris]